jgi:tetratricopeptide (TPR) repeat protein
MIGTLSLSDMAFGLLQAGRAPEAQRLIDRALRLSLESDLTRSSIHLGAVNRAASIALRSRRFDEARQLYTEALSLATALGNDYDATWTRLSIAELEFQTGNTAKALDLASAVEGETNGPRTKSHALLALANVAAYRLALGDRAGARVAAREALRLGRGAYVQAPMIAIQHLATVAALGGDVRRGSRLRGYVDAWYRSEGYEREPTERRAYEILLAALRDRLSDAEIEALAGEGAALSEDQAVAEALAV